MNYQTVVAIIVCMVFFLPVAFGAVFRNPSVHDFAVAVGCLILLPYTVNCMVVGECNVYAWLVAGTMVWWTVGAVYYEFVTAKKQDRQSA